MRSREIAIWLTSIHGVSRGTIKFIEDYYGSLDEFWLSKKTDIPINNMASRRRQKIELIYSEKSKNNISNYFDELKKANGKVTTIFDSDYPEKLRLIPDFPYVLYYKGKLEFTNKSIAIIGARKATYYGLWAAEKFSKKIASENIDIISGLAKGIDTIAHKGALDVNKKTFAVLGNGIDVVYPKSNEKLYRCIEEQGAIISEYPLGMIPKPQNFPQRNRIISGLADAVLVIEAKEKSGTLITVNFALEQGKDVLAIPGNINSLYSAGTNQLIKDGAQLVMEPQDVLESLCGPYDIVIDNNVDSLVLTNEEKIIYNIVRNGPIHLDMIKYETNYSTSDLNSILTLLEIKGIILKLPGNIFQLKD